jgi:hypothetical protein
MGQVESGDETTTIKKTRAQEAFPFIAAWQVPREKVFSIF